MLEHFRLGRCIAIVSAILGILAVVDFGSWAIAPYAYSCHNGNDTNQCTYRGGAVISGLTLAFQFIGGLTPEAWTALATIAIATFTTALFIVGHGQLKIAERALIELEEPFLYPVIIAKNFREKFEPFIIYTHPNSPHSPVSPGVAFELKNFGRTVALPQSVIATLFAGNADDVIDEKAMAAHEAVLGGGEKSEALWCPVIKPISFDEYCAIRDGKSHIFFRGSVVFYDVFGNGHFQWFCLRWEMKIDRFVAWGPDRNKRGRFSPSSAPPAPRPKS